MPKGILDISSSLRLGMMNSTQDSCSSSIDTFYSLMVRHCLYSIDFRWIIHRKLLWIEARTNIIVTTIITYHGTSTPPSLSKDYAPYKRCLQISVHARTSLFPPSVLISKRLECRISRASSMIYTRFILAVQFDISLRIHFPLILPRQLRLNKK
jgi:hypothetical protein